VTERATHRRIADELRQRIEAGELSPGAMVPSEAALTARYEVARGTVRAALALLLDEGHIEVVPGQGRRVTGASAAERPALTAYERIAAALRDRVEAGEFRPEDSLPSEAALMAEYGVSRNTVRRAYRHLAEAGAVVIRHGAGAFPAPR
jgi:DNA-binding GntR family transcriptional regulator